MFIVEQDDYHFFVKYVLSLNFYNLDYDIP